MPRDTVEIAGPTYDLRPPDKDVDLLFCFNMIHHPKVYPYLSTRPPATLDQEREWLESMRHSSDAMHFIIMTHEFQPIGMAGLHHINRISGTAEVGAWVVPEFQHHGVMTEVMCTLGRWAFYQHNFRKLNARVFACNAGSLRLVAKCGYVQEATLRDQHFVDGRYWDETLWYIDRPLFDQAYTRLYRG